MQKKKMYGVISADKCSELKFKSAENLLESGFIKKKKVHTIFKVRNERYIIIRYNTVQWRMEAIHYGATVAQ